MNSSFGGQFLFETTTATNANVGLTSNGTVPPVPGSVSGALNIEAFTGVTVPPAPTLPALASGFNVGVTVSDTVSADAAPSLVNGFLTGTQLHLFDGNYRVIDSVTGSAQQTPALIIVSGSQTVTGAPGDTLFGGTSPGQFLDGSKGGGQLLSIGTGPSLTVVGGSGDTVLGNSNSSVAAQIVGAPSMFIQLPVNGSEIITSAVGDTITGAASQAFSATILIAGARADSINFGLGPSGTIIGANSTLLGAASADPSSGDMIRAGGGATTVIGGSFDTIAAASEALFGGNGRSQIIATQGSMSILVDGGGLTTISSGGSDTITADASPGVSFGNLAVAAGRGDLINLTGFTGFSGILGATEDTITTSSKGTGIDASAGTIGIIVPSSATITGSTVGGSGDTITGVSGAGLGGSFDYNPGASGASVTGSDLLNLSGWAGNATINAFSSAATQFAAVNDTILAGNGADSVWGGGGDRIGVGSFSAGSTVNPGGTHRWDHATSVIGASIGFGTNDTVVAATYDTLKGTATSNPSVAGASSATITVDNFQSASDYLFYQNESVATTGAIVLTATTTTVGGSASSVITLPDGSRMTLVGVAAVAPTMFKA